MLAKLKIENFALIERLDIEFGPGLNVITGETGAGKSIILSALSLILGERATEGLIRDGCDFLTVEAVFFAVNARLKTVFEQFNLPGMEEESLVIKREVKRNGRNRCFVNNETVTLGVLKEIGDHLVDLHGQHEHQSLLHPEKQRQILDAYGSCQKLQKQVSKTYGKYRATLSSRKKLKEESEQFQAQQSFYQHQYDELSALDLRTNEEELLLKESELHAHTEKLTELAIGIEQYFQEGAAAPLNLITALGAIGKNLEEISRVKSEFAPLAAKIKEAQETLEVVSQQTENFHESFTYDPQRLDWIESRLSALQRAQKQYNCSIAELIAYQRELADKLADMGSFNKQEQALLTRGKEEKETLEQLLAELSASRQKAKTQLEKDLVKVARQLALSSIRFTISLNKTETDRGFTMSDGKTYRISPEGLEEVEFLFSANPGVSLRPLSRIASGGEISRLMLALKTVIAQEDIIPTLIFDEIDVGIGGKVARIVGEKLVEVSKRHQIMVITHLPQIASRAKQHYLVDKTLSGNLPQVQIRLISDEERITELARMLGGEESSKVARKHAQEMIAHD